MGAVTSRAYQLALLIKKSLDDVTGTQQRALEAIVQYQYKSFSLINGIFTESCIATSKEMSVLRNI